MPQWSTSPIQGQVTRPYPTPASHWMEGLLVACLLMMSLHSTWTSSSAAAAEEWGSAKRDGLTVLMEPNQRLSASSFLDAYGDFAATAIEEISLLLNGPTLDRPIILLIYAEGHIYDSAVASADRVEPDGVIAVADPEHAAVLIPLNRFIALVPSEAENQLRHAIAHIMLGQASGFQMPRGFDEGFARYVERVNQPSLARIASIVQGAYQESSLASWSNMNRVMPLDDPDLVEAQSYASVGFLLRNHGLAAFQEFVSELQTASDWREAMNLAYAPADSDSLERQWRDDIPVWAQGDWRWNLVAGFDLQPARDLLARGNYAGASNALLVSEQLLSEVQDPVRLAEITELKDLARIGELAEAKMLETQQALENFAYERAYAAIEQAAEQYEHLPANLRPTALIDQYREMAQTGLASTDQLEIARIEAGAWSNYPEARAEAVEAGSGFAALGDTSGHQDALSLIEEMDNTQRQLVLLLGSLALLTIVWLTLWLWYRQPPGLKWDGER